MKLQNIGEFGLIEEYIAPEFKELVKKHVTGIGDDCAIIPINDTISHIHTTDMLIEKTHFLKDKITPYQLGFKSLAVNLSDIAAMGGSPIGSYLSIGFPKDIEVEWIEQFMKGYKALSQQEEVPLLGGDTTSSEDKIVINVGVTGEMETHRIKKRTAAKTGDLICLTGEVGDSAGGLQVILKDLPVDEFAEKLLQQHLKPYPHVSEGKWLSRFDGVHAMMDVSDGISSDLRHILKASRRKGIVDLERIPLSKALTEYSSEHDLDALELGVSGGEDYVLLLTIDPNDYEEIDEAFRDRFQKPLYRIGTIDEGEPEITYRKDEQEFREIKKGYSHF